jgi:hypothetical protein
MSNSLKIRVPDSIKKSCFTSLFTWSKTCYAPNSVDVSACVVVDMSASVVEVSVPEISALVEKVMLPLVHSYFETERVTEHPSFYQTASVVPVPSDANKNLPGETPKDSL